MENTLSHSSCLTQLKGVGPKVQEKLNKLGLHVVQDVLFHLPYRYEDRTRIVSIASLRHGQSALIEGTIDSANVAFTRKGKSRRMLIVQLSDATGPLTLRFFYFNRQQQDTLVEGTRLRCFGDVRYGVSSLEIVHPEYSTLASHNSPQSSSQNSAQIEKSLTPVYHTIEGVSQVLLRRLSTQCLELLSHNHVLPDFLTPELFAQNEYYSLSNALMYVHRPPANAHTGQLIDAQHASQLRLIFEELLAQHLSLQTLREQNKQYVGIQLTAKPRFSKQFLKNLPFEFTGAQQRVSREILNDLASGAPMMRLVQGDVGSGKTVVAALACQKF